MKLINVALLKAISLFLFLVSSLVAYGQKTYVVSVGIGTYLHPDVAPSLPCSVNDARAMAHFFHDYNGSEVFMLLNQNATHDHILKVLKSHFSKSTENDEIIFFFCGHGLQGGLTSYDIQDASTVITYNDIQDIMLSAKARRKIIIAMSCFSGGLTLKKLDNGNNNYSQRKTKKTSVMIFTSSRADEPSWMRKDMTNSFFVNRILKAFHGAADRNGDRKITARELFNYVSPNVALDTGLMQHPQMWGSFDDSMVVVYVK